MRSLALLNKLIKSSRRWSKKTRLSLFDRLHHTFLAQKQKRIFEVLEALNVMPETAQTAEPGEKIVWVCWFQGIEQAPALVKRCIESIQNHVGQARVIILNDENIKTYISLPAWISDKYQKGLISKAHYSDIVRCTLLAQYGGIWMDATVYVTQPVPEHLFHHDFSSLRFDDASARQAISQGYWTAYFLAAKKNDPFITFVRDIFYRYWQQHDELIEYFLIDYTLRFAIEKYAFFKAQVEQQPVIGNNRFYIRQFINEPLNDSALEQLRQDPVGIYKLSHKERYRESKNSAPTLYSQIIDGSFNLNA